MNKKDIEEIMAQHVSQLREMGWKAEPFSNNSIGFVVEYNNGAQFNYYYDENGEICKCCVSFDIKSRSKLPNYYTLTTRALKLLCKLPIDTRTINKFFDEIVDDTVFGYEPETKSAFGATKLMFELFGKKTDRLAKRILDTDEYIKYLEWRINTKNL